MKKFKSKCCLRKRNYSLTDGQRALTRFRVHHFYQGLQKCRLAMHSEPSHAERSYEKRRLKQGTVSGSNQNLKTSY